MTQQAPTDEEIRAVAESMRMQPWGIGSRQEDAIAYGRALLAQYGSPAEREIIEAAHNLVKIQGRYHGEAR